MTISARPNSRRQTAGGEPAKSNLLRSAMLLLGLCTCVALFYSYTMVRSLDVSYQTSRALERQKELREVGRRLRLELNSLRAPHRLEQAAQRSGFQQPSPQQLRSLH